MMTQLSYKLLSMLICLNLLSLKSHGQSDDNSFINTISGYKDSVPANYVPPIISNGSLSMQVDFLGGQEQKKYVGMIPGIYWAGRRYGSSNDYKLIPFGHFTNEIYVDGSLQKEPETWSQKLNVKDGVVKCINNYKDVKVETIVFIPLTQNLIVIKKRFLPTSSETHSVRFNFKYDLNSPGNQNILPTGLLIKGAWEEVSQSLVYKYKVYGKQLYNGEVSVFSDASVRPIIDKLGSKLTLNVPLSKGKAKEATFYLLLEDSMDGDHYENRLDKLRKMARQKRFEALLDSNRAKWDSYWNKSYVHLPVKKLENVYNTAQYNLRANATQWSFPVGIFPSHWSGRYFGWDEMFCFQALASSNHLAISKRVPEFRFSCLSLAQRRVRHRNNEDIYGARYPWETLEDGTEGSPPGYWRDHIFHMANITVSCWLQYLYTGDQGYLDSIGYPVIRACSRFYMSHSVYHDSNGRVYIGKVTDLERLGPGKENAFLTTCGIIYTLNAAAKAAKILNRDIKEASKWEEIAEKLQKYLPHDKEKYIPYPDCEEKSIAVLGSLFPYPLFDTENKFQYNAAYDFYKNAKVAGNMYSVGSGVSPWYAAWMTIALAQLGDRDKPVKLLLNAAGSTGYFNELFEINEPKVSMHPWFSTASGNFVYAVNQMLLRCKNDQLFILPATPVAWRNFSYKLSAYGNLVISVNVENGKISKLSLYSTNVNRTVARTLVIPQQYLDKKFINKNTVVSEELSNGDCLLHIKFRGNKAIILESKT